MSRLTEALKLLLGKCTPEGATPASNSVDDIVECIAAHFSLADYVFENEVNTDELLRAVEDFKNGGASITWNGKRVILAYRNGDYVSIRYAEAPCVAYVYNVTGETVKSNAASKYFYDQTELIVKVNADGTTITSADKTYVEILTAYNAGRTVVVNMHGSVFHLSFVGEANFRFSRVFVKSSTASDICGLVVDSSDKWTYTIHAVTNG